MKMAGTRILRLSPMFLASGLHGVLCRATFIIRYPNMSEIRERIGEVGRSKEKSSEWDVRVGGAGQRRRAIEKELVRMTADFERATEVLTPGNPFVPELRSKRAALLEELYRLRTGGETVRT